MQPQKKTFNLKGKADTTAGYSKEKTKPGRHLVVTADARHKNGHKGQGFWIDFEVLAAAPGVATQKGFKGAVGVYPEEAQASGQMTREMAVAKEYGKIAVFIAALFGFSRAQADAIADDETVYDRITARAPKTGVSCTRGRVFVLDCVEHVKQKGPKAGQTTSYYEMLPYHPSLFPEFADVVLPDYAVVNPLNGDPAVATIGPDSAPQISPKNDAPPPPAGNTVAVKSFDEIAVAEGWTKHPTANDCWYKGQESLYTPDLKARLGA